MKDNVPLISVIIPVLDGEAYISEAIDSVLSQTWPNIEIIVIDDGSTDGTAALIARDYPDVRYLYQPNAGIGAARNRGIKRAGGDYITFLDADDYWSEDKLERQMRVFRDQPDVEMVFGHARQFHSPELTPEERARLPIANRLMPAELPATLLCRRGLFGHVGLFETHLRVGQDMSWIMRARDLKVKIVMLPDVVSMRRLHRNNNANTKSQDMGDRLKFLKEMLDRRRAATASVDE
jgi:glycosyltransferase involved in cell wall biosynthesis